MKSWERHLGSLLIVLRLDSIRRKIVVLAVLATLVPATSTAVLSHVQNRRALTETIEGELQGIGSQAARELDLWLKERLYDLKVYAGSPEVWENLENIGDGGPSAADGLSRLTNYLRGVRNRSPDYTEVAVLDSTGTGIATSRSPARPIELPEAWLSDLKAGEGVVGEPYLDPATGWVLAIVAQPIVRADTRFLGVVAATLTFTGQRDVLAGLSPSEGGSVDLVVAGGARIVGSVSEAALDAALPDRAFEMLSEAEGGTVEYDRGDGVTVLGTLTQMPRMGWSVVTQIPTEDAYDQISQLTRSTVLLVLGLLAFVGFAAYFLGLFIVQPLTRLAEAAASVGSGDLSVDLPVTGGGEVGYLTGVFNRMVAELRRNREQLADANEALRRQNEELALLSMTDALTGLYNRRYLMDELEKEIQRAERHDRSLAVLMLDLDRFKDYNDAHGHPAGDEVLIAMGNVIEDATRDPDVPGRFGGEEFIVLMPDCDEDGALEVAERIRTRLTGQRFDGGTVTCSIGAAVYPEHGADATSLIAAADVALYEAKAAGRDRTAAARIPVGVGAGKKGSRAAKRSAKGGRKTGT